MHKIIFEYYEAGIFCEILFFLRAIPTSGNLILELDTDACKGAATEINYLEHVQAIVTLNSTRRGDVTMYLLSPSGTR
jgi:proprotein convertase subtilisin/kexin type 2